LSVIIARRVFKPVELSHNRSKKRSTQAERQPEKEQHVTKDYSIGITPLTCDGKTSQYVDSEVWLKRPIRGPTTQRYGSRGLYVDTEGKGQKNVRISMTMQQTRTSERHTPIRRRWAVKR
jgi:hypothetical protein